MTKLRKYITYDQIKAMDSCYEPEEIGIEKGYKATIPNFIKDYRYKVKSREDIIWVLARKQYMTDRDMRLFAVWCAREALKLVDEPDPRSINSCDVAERFANGEATQEELYAARAAARDADWDAARAAASAAMASAWDAARAAASAAARAAARDAARDARAAAWDAQIDHLLTYFENESKQER